MTNNINRGQPYNTARGQPQPATENKQQRGGTSQCWQFCLLPLYIEVVGALTKKHLPQLSAQVAVNCKLHSLAYYWC